MQHTAEFISLLLSFPTIILAIAVVYLWGPEAVRSLKSKEKKSPDFFIIGVAIGFLGQMLDNFYWTIPWSLSFIDSSETDSFMSSGVLFNIFSRQACGIIAAYCHIKSYLLYRDEQRNKRAKEAGLNCNSNLENSLKYLNYFSFILGFVYVIVLYCIRTGWYTLI